MIHIAMVDDERASLDLFSGALTSGFAAKGEHAEISAFTSSLDFLATLSDTRYDLVCLDVIMEPLIGTEVAAKLREIDPDVPLVFISSNENKVFGCFNYNPAGFIRKTNFFDDAVSFIDHYLTAILPKRKKRRTLLVKVHGDTTIIDMDKIFYIEGNHNYQSFHLEGEAKPIEVRELISTLEKQLEPFGFIRVHKGFIVNCAVISKLGNTEITLTDGSVIPVSQQRREDVYRRYLELTKDSLTIS